jgi:outer membrane protein OmpA-like peptidoglycan-associated protein
MFDVMLGEMPLLVADFADDVIGDFPRRLEASEGNFEVVEWQGSRWLRANGSTNVMLVSAGAPLSSRWTLEFELLSEDGYNECWIYPAGSRDNNAPHLRFSAGHTASVIRDDGRNAGSSRGERDSRPGRAYTARVMADGRYLKAFVNEARAINVPNFDYTRGSNVMFYCDGTEQKPVFLRNIRLAAGGRKLYDALTENGRVATQGIYFNTGSDQLRPESTPTLKEIGTMLTEHADLRLTIEGHTDNTGAAAANKTLSEKRAEAVRQYLVTTYGIAASRLIALGVGQDKPVAANTTPEVRQQNRRVELVQVK